MTIHDDARTAFQHVYDAELERLAEEAERLGLEADALRVAKADAEAREEAASLALTESESETGEAVAEREAAITARDGALTELSVARQTLTERDALITSLRARIAELEAATPPAPATDNYLPFSAPNLQAYLDAGFGPAYGRTADAKMPNGAPLYVTWPADKPLTWDVESQFRAMQPGQILVLPERDAEYPIDSTDGFVAVGVASYRDTFAKAMGQPEVIPISNKWHGQTARTWWAMARMRRGIIGLGPKAVVRPSDSGFTRFPQSPNSRYAAYYTNTAGAEQKITGNQEKLIDHSPDDTLNGVKVTGVNANPYVGNFTIKGRSFGSYDIAPLGDPAQTKVGVAYHGIIANGMTMENMHFDSSWRGHGFSPNSETGAFAVGGYHDVRNITIDGRDAGRTTLVMSNNVTNGAVMENVKVLNPRGGLVRWSCSGKHIWKNVWIPAGGNINIEDNLAGFELEWTGGSIGSYVNLRSPRGSSKITLRDVANLGTYPRLTFNVWARAGADGKPNEPVTQLASDLKAFDKAGNPVPISVTGAVAA